MNTTPIKAIQPATNSFVERTAGAAKKNKQPPKIVLANANTHSRDSGAEQSVVVKNCDAFNPGHAKNQANRSVLGGSDRRLAYSTSVCSLISPNSDNEIQHIVTNGLRFGTSTHAGINRPSIRKKALIRPLDFDGTDIARPGIAKATVQHSSF